MNEWLQKSQILFNQLCELEEIISNSKFDSNLHDKIKIKTESLVNDSFISLGMLNSFLIEVDKTLKGKNSYLNEWFNN